MVEKHCCFIKKEYFEDNPNLIKILDVRDDVKKSRRTHVCVFLEIDGNTFYIPLRNNLKEPNRKFGIIGFSVPAETRPNAGLDYRYVLLINDKKYIEPHIKPRIPEPQYKIIDNNYDLIKKQFAEYLQGYIFTAKKNRVDRNPLYRESSLINFHKELGIE